MRRSARSWCWRSPASACSVWYYELPFREDLEARQTQLTALRNDIAKGQATAKQLRAVPRRGRRSRSTPGQPSRRAARRKGRRRSAAPDADGRHAVEPDDQELQAGTAGHQAAARRVADRAGARRHVPQPRDFLRSHREVHAHRQHHRARRARQGTARPERDDRGAVRRDHVRPARQTGAAEAGRHAGPAAAAKPAA